MPLTSLLPRDELGRRMRAARELRGMSQDALDEKFDEDGHGKQDAGRLERGDERIGLTRARLDSLVRHLRVPEEWFTSADVDVVVGWPARDTGQAPDVLELLRRIDQRLSALQVTEGATGASAEEQPPDELGHDLSTDPPTPENPQQEQNPEEEENQQDDAG